MTFVVRIRRWLKSVERERRVLRCIEVALDALEYKNEDGIHSARASLYEARSYILK